MEVNVLKGIRKFFFAIFIYLWILFFLSKNGDKKRFVDQSINFFMSGIERRIKVTKDEMSQETIGVQSKMN